MILSVNQEFRDLLPQLSKEELALLEEGIKKDGCISPIITWKGVIIDGYNRYGICKRNNIEFKVVEMEFDTKDDVIIWMIDTQIGRRNINDAIKFSFIQKKMEILKAKGKEKMEEAGKNFGMNHSKEGLSHCDKSSSEESHDTQKQVAKDLGWSTGKTAQADIAFKKATPEQKEDMFSGKRTIRSVYDEVKEPKKREEPTAPKIVVDDIPVIFDMPIAVVTPVDDTELVKLRKEVDRLTEENNRLKVKCNEIVTTATTIQDRYKQLSNNTQEALVKAKSIIKEVAGKEFKFSADKAIFSDEIIEAGYKALAKKYHPDAGGTVEQFKALGALVREVKQYL